MKKGHGRASTTKYFDYSLLFLIIFLIGFGLVMLYSVSAYEGQDVFGDPTYYLKRQAIFAAGGFVLMLVISKIPYTFWKSRTVATGIYVLSLILLVMVLAIGTGSNGSVRWLEIGPIRFQPSETTKIAVIIYMAYMLSRMPYKIRDFRNVFAMLIRIAPSIAIIAYSNLSTALIIAGIFIIMLFVASPKVKHVALILGCGVGLAIVGIAAMGYRSTRIRAWLHPNDYPDDAYQTMQGMYAIGSGGLFGKGLGNSMMKLGYVPEAQNDFIFSIICEELGMFGAICVILLFVLVIWRFMIIANNAEDLFGSMVCVGVMAHIALQVIFNIAVVTNMMPNTGVTLPFISYGGTSLVILLAEMGIVLSISRSIRIDALSGAE